MSQSSSNSPRRYRRVLWLLALPGLALALILGGRTFVADTYTIDSGSMLPSLRIGEHVLVRFTRDRQFRRFDLVVFEPVGGGPAMVKRIGALPGEQVLIDGGDLVIDGAKLGPDAPRPEPTPVYDMELHDPRSFFHLEQAPDGPWTVVSEPVAERSLRVDASAVRRGSDSGLAFFHKDLRDVWLDRSGHRQGGLAQVGDGILWTDYAVESDPAADGLRVRWRLVEAGDTFEVVLGGGEAQLVRRPGRSAPTDVLARCAFDLAERPGGRLRLANIDDHLTVHLDGELLIESAYAGNQEFLGVTAGNDRTSAPRVAFGAEQGVVRFSAVRIGRDLHFDGRGSYATQEPLVLGLDEVFLLGDNSADSADGRYFGPVSLKRVVGIPVAVTQPWSQSRWLGRGRTITGDSIDGGPRP